MSWLAYLCLVIFALTAGGLLAKRLCKVKGRRHRLNGKHHSRGNTNGR